MHRMNPERFNSKPRHEALQIEMLKLIATLSTLVDNREPIVSVQRDWMIAVLDRSRRELDGCTTSLHDMVMRIADERWPNHMDLISWINGLSIDLKLMGIDPGSINNHHPQPITPERLDEGQRMVMELDSCRQRIKFD